MDCTNRGSNLRVLGSALLMAFCLAGCGLPPAINVASFIADGISYVATGKSTTDHAISAVVGEDCALIRVVEEKAVCNPDGEVSFDSTKKQLVDKHLKDPDDLTLVAYDGHIYARILRGKIKDNPS